MKQPCTCFLLSGKHGKCVYGMSQISPSDVCSETPSWVTGGNCTSEAGRDGPLWLTEVVSSHTCVLYTQAKRIQTHIKYNHYFEELTAILEAVCHIREGSCCMLAELMAHSHPFRQEV